jgi:hypothetical protein
LRTSCARERPRISLHKLRHLWHSFDPEGSPCKCIMLGHRIRGFYRLAALGQLVVYRSFCKFRFGRWQEVLPGGRPGCVAPGAAARQSGIRCPHPNHTSESDAYIRCLHPNPIPTSDQYIRIRCVHLMSISESDLKVASAPGRSQYCCAK